MDKLINISFVIIAKNEQFGIEKCLTSITKLHLENCQVICIDSGSNDDTLKVMQRYKSKIESLDILKIEGYSNAAVARNAGIKILNKDYVFFVDGDVEIEEDFLFQGLKYFKDKEADCVTGQLKEFRYNSNFTRVESIIEDRFRFKNEEKIYASGGCFFTTYSVVSDIGFFDERLERSQDYDYTLRISSKYRMLAIPFNMGIHHTIHYENPKRLIEHIKKFHPVFLGNVIAKNCSHLKGISWLLYKREKGFLLGFFIVLLSILLLCVSATYGWVIALFLFATDITHGKMRNNKIPYRIFLHYFSPVLITIGLFYIIDNVKNYKIIEINS